MKPKVKLTNRQKWFRTIIWLKRTFPAQLFVVVRTRKIEKEFLGTTECKNSGFPNERFAVEINTGMSVSMKIETLIHEWAHVISWFGAGHEEDHPDDWGLAYARIYRAFLDWEYGE